MKAGTHEGKGLVVLVELVDEVVELVNGEQRGGKVVGRN